MTLRDCAGFYLVALLLSGCGEEEIVQSKFKAKAAASAEAEDAPKGKKKKKDAADGATGADDTAGAADAGPVRPPEFGEHEWVESERSRDPFRSFEMLFLEEARGQVQSQREVILEQYSVDELHLIGIVTRLHPEIAMVVDPTGKGHVIQRGQLIGKAERVQIAGQNARSFDINWRVEQVREGDVILVREDPQNPDVPSVTRVLALRPDEEIEL